MQKVHEPTFLLSPAFSSIGMEERESGSLIPPFYNGGYEDNGGERS